MTTFKIPITNASNKTVPRGRIFYLSRRKKCPASTVARAHKIMTDLDTWKAKPALELLQHAQAIVDKYQHAMAEADYLALCNANRSRYARTIANPRSPPSVNSRRAIDRTTEDDGYATGLTHLRNRLRVATTLLRQVPRQTTRVTPSLKQRAVRALARELGLSEDIQTYHQLRDLHPEIKDEKDFYAAAIPIINRRAQITREDLRNHIAVLRARIRLLETRLSMDIESTSFLS